MDIPFEEFRDKACKHPEHEPGLSDQICTYPWADDRFENCENGEIPCNQRNCPFMISDKRRHRQEHKAKYIMKYKCWNCGTEFCSLIKKGEPALGHGGKCSYCGIADKTDKAHAVVCIAKVC